MVGLFTINFGDDEEAELERKVEKPFIAIAIPMVKFQLSFKRSCIYYNYYMPTYLLNYINLISRNISSTTEKIHVH